MREVSMAEALAGKYPEWVVWVVSTDVDGKPNIMPAGWAMVCNASPLMFAVAIGLGSYTHQCLEETGEFALAWPAPGQAELIDQLGGCTGREVNKFERFALQAKPSQHIAAPLVEGCAIAFECVVVSQVELEDHSIFVGEVMAAYVADPPLPKLDNFDGNYAVAAPATGA